jgi:hypothetical protein
MKTRGYAIVLDAILALSIALIILIGFTSYYKQGSEETAFKQLHYTTEDVFDALNKQGVLDDVGEEWAAANGSTNSTDWLSAQNMSRTYLEMLIPHNMGYRLMIEDSVLIESNDSQRVSERDAPAETNSERLLVGYGKGLPTRGFVSRAFMTNIRAKTNEIYSYFGGFVGQGEITQYLRDVPDDAFIQQACMEMNAGDEFDLYVNDVMAGHFTPSGGSGMDANIKGPSGCIANPRTYFQSGDNKLTLKFTGGDINKKYVGGGFLKVVYNTTLAETEEMKKTQTDWTPEIHGLINYYSSVYIPGSIDSMDLYLHFKCNATTYMTLGDVVVLNTDTNESHGYCTITNQSEYNCTIPDANLSKKIHYNELGEKTIPIKIGIGNVSQNSNIDVILVNDKSGSMRQSGWWLNASGNASNAYVNVTVPNGGWSATKSFTINTSVKNIAAAITWGSMTGFNGSDASEFVVNLRRPDGTWIFSEYPGNPASAGNVVDPPDSVGNANEYYSGIDTKPQALIVQTPAAGTWQVSVYGWNMRPKTGPPANMSVNISIYMDTNLTSADDINHSNTTFAYIASQLAADSFLKYLSPNDYAGYVKFETSSLLAQGLTQNLTRVEYAINNTGVGGGTSIDLGINDANNEMIAHARSNTQHLIILLTDGQNDNGPSPVIQSANYAKNNGTKIFTIGLSAFANADMLKQVASKPEYYYYAPTQDDLQSIYQQIAGVINATYRSQILNVTQNVNYTILYGDSNLLTHYTPVDVTKYGELTFVLSTPPFNNVATCKGYLYVPNDVTIVDARVTSYSGQHWTDFLNVQNSLGSNDVYKLWYDYGALQYPMLGDPYLIQISPDYLPSAVNNTFTVGTGDSQSARTSCSLDDRAIYTIRLRMTVDYGDVYPNADGCIWTVEFEDGSTMTTTIPTTYNGTKQCYYTSSNVTTGTYDSMDNAVYRLMNHLDIDKNGRVNVIFDSSSVNFEIGRAGGVKSLWGPTKFRLILWM